MTKSHMEFIELVFQYRGKKWGVSEGLKTEEIANNYSSAIQIRNLFLYLYLNFSLENLED